MTGAEYFFNEGLTSDGQYMWMSGRYVLARLSLPDLDILNISGNALAGGLATLGYDHIGDFTWQGDTRTCAVVTRLTHKRLLCGVARCCPDRA